MKQILIATKNNGKIREFEALFKKYNIEVQSLADLAEDIADIEETGTTFAENAALKAEMIQNLLNQPVLADDSGLVVDALDGEPGIYSARYAGEAATDEQNNAKLLNELKDTPESARTARFVCTLAVSIPGEETIYETGYVEGKIADKLTGENGFGYDPLFIPIGYDVTMAELSPEEKNKLSHRAMAIKKLEIWVEQLVNF